jgi:Flp pilus assembly protein TadG
VIKSIRHKLGDRGTAAVEFALVAPVLLLLVFGIIDFGRMINARINITAAAREGARAAASAPSGSAAAAAQAAATRVAGVPVTVDAPSPTCPAAPTTSDYVSVTVHYSFTFDTPVGFLLGHGGSQTLDMTATGVMPCRG